MNTNGMKKVLLSILIALSITGFIFLAEKKESATELRNAEIAYALADMQLKIDALQALADQQGVPIEDVRVGADGTGFAGLSTYYLSGSGITSSASSIGLTSFTIKQSGQELITADFGNTIFLTLEPGSATRQEFAQCTTVTQGAGTAATLSGCTRGHSPIPDYSASTTLRFPHSGGTAIIVSNSPSFYANFAVKNNDETISGLWTYSSTSVPKLDYNPTSAGWTALASTTFATIGRLSDIALASAVPATESVVGYVELATALESASSTILGSTGAGLALQARYATDTPNSATRGSKVLMSDIGGYLKQGWINLTETFTWTGAQLWTASSTHTATTSVNASNVLSNAFIINNVPYQFPSSQCAANQSFVNNGSGVLTCKNINKYSFAGVGPNASSNSATTTLFTIPGGTMSASSTIEFHYVGTSLYNGGGGTVYLAASIAWATSTLISFSCSEGTNAETAQCSGSGLVSFVSASSQTSTTLNETESQAGVGTVSGGGAGTSAVNFASDVLISVWSLAPVASNNMNVTSFYVTVNP
jgi:hypothetical protein